MYSSLVKSGSSAAFGKALNTKSFERIGSALLRSREARTSAHLLTTFDWGVVASILVILNDEDFCSRSGTEYRHKDNVTSYIIEWL